MKPAPALSIVLAMAFAVATSAGARCIPPEATLTDPEAAAEFLLDQSDFVGIVTFEPAAANGPATIFPVRTYKGQQGGSIALRTRVTRMPDGSDVAIVTNAITPGLGFDHGPLSVAAISFQEGVSGTSECASYILNRIDLTGLMRALEARAETDRGGTE